MTSRSHHSASSVVSTVAVVVAIGGTAIAGWTRREMNAKRVGAVLVALVAAVVCAVPVSAGGAARDPLSLVLQRSDFPAKTRLTSAELRTYATKLKRRVGRG